MGMFASVTRKFKPRNFGTQNILRAHHAEEGALIEDAPAKVKLGMTKVFAIVVPFTYLGALVSKRGAEFLEEWNIFVPEDDDD